MGKISIKSGYGYCSAGGVVVTEPADPHGSLALHLMTKSHIPLTIRVRILAYKT